MTRTSQRLVYGTLGLILLAGIILRLIDAAAPPPPKKIPTPFVSVAKPEHRDLTYTLDYEGDVLPVLQANIFSKVAGTLEAVYTDMGHTVRGGQLIALIDTTEAYQSLLLAQAAYENARAGETRTRELAAKKLTSLQDVDNAVAQLRSTKANYEAARIRLDYAKIRAPFHGYITKRYLDAGTTVSATPTTTSGASTIYTIMDIDSVKVLVNVLDLDVPNVRPGLKATVTVDALPGKMLTGYVARTAQAISTGTRTMPVEIVIPNRDGELKPGSFARVQLVLGEHPNALTVPTEAVMQDKEGSYVLTLADTLAKRLPVKTGLKRSGVTEILSGLSGSEDVIIVGQTFAKPDGRVQLARPSRPTATETK